MISSPRTAHPVAIALLVFLGAGSSAATANFVPHRAVYNLSLDRALPGSGVADVSGRVVYELTGNECQGYTQRMRFVTVTVNQEGKSQTTDLRTSSWEDIPSRELRFTSTNYQGDKLADQTQGEARRGGGTGPVTVALARPARRTVKLEKDVYFPIQHSMEIVRTARAGGSLFSAALYDGSESGDKVYATSTAIGSETSLEGEGVNPPLKVGDKLKGVPGWPVSVSYYGPDTGAHVDQTPVYEMWYRFHANGVTSSLRIDHGEFALRGELQALDYLPAGICAAGPARPR